MSKADTTRWNFAMIATDGENTIKVSDSMESVINCMKHVLYDYVQEAYAFDTEEYDKWVTDIHMKLIQGQGHLTLRFGRTEVLLTLCEYRFKY
tara:strand:+ start:2299 stop:2577 length:279 start_codon:yes stop_codon:yes gene_type:complete